MPELMLVGFGVDTIEKVGQQQPIPCHRDRTATFSKGEDNCLEIVLKCRFQILASKLEKSTNVGRLDFHGSSACPATFAGRCYCACADALRFGQIDR